MPYHTLRQGDCIQSLARENGFIWETIWEHAENSEIRELRKDPSVLRPGDRIFIPERRERVYTEAVEQRHRFVRKGLRTQLRVQIQAEPPPEPEADTSQQEQGEAQVQALSNTPFLLDVDGEQIHGQTDGDGYVNVSIPANARQARLTLDPDTTQERILEMQLGGLDPAEEITGAKHRLHNLGFPCGESDESQTPELESALRSFQDTYGLTVNGELNDETKAKLREEHGS